MIPAALLAVFAYRRIARQWTMPPFSSVRLMALGGDAYDLLLAAAWLLFAWAAIDYLVEWHSREQRLKMSRQEMREEFKESEGNPQIRARIRNLQRAARRRRMQADVSRAAVVVTNPTHYAVALAFDFETMEAPKVLAKGRNLLAEEIKDQARWAGVPILENPPLARSLYRSVEPGESIPVDLYAAVASILAFLYRQRVEQELRQRRERARTANGAPGWPPPGRNGTRTAVESAGRAIIPATRERVRRAGPKSPRNPANRSSNPSANPSTEPSTNPSPDRGNP
jgi:flagellar biosynthetic protein FlhB